MRASRRPTCWRFCWLSVLLLSVQIATAAYACPAAVQAPVVLAEMPGCSGNMPGAMDPDQPQLCQAHCQQGSQTVQPTPTSDVPATPVLIAVLDWRHVALLPTQPACRTSIVTPGGSPPGSPPLYLSLLVLRN